jgi:hypothetical protein
MPLPTSEPRLEAPSYGLQLIAGQSARQQIGLRSVPSLPTDTTKAAPKRITSGTNTSGYAATAARPMSVPGTTNAIAAVGCRSLRSTMLASAPNATAGHRCRSGHLPRVLRPQPVQIWPLIRL